jgi:hypothetical protein
VASQTVEHDAAHAGSHFTRALVLHRKADASAVAREADPAKNYWRDADSDRPKLKKLADLGMPPPGLEPGTSGL